MHRRPAPLATAVRRQRTAQSALFAQAAYERIMLGRGGEPLTGGEARSDAEEAVGGAFRQSPAEGGDRLLTTVAEPGAGD